MRLTWFLLLMILAILILLVLCFVLSLIKSFKLKAGFFKRLKEVDFNKWSELRKPENKMRRPLALYSLDDHVKNELSSEFILNQSRAYSDKILDSLRDEMIGISSYIYKLVWGMIILIIALLVVVRFHIG